MAERRLSPSDAAWLYSEWDKNHQTVSCMLWMDREVDPDALLAIIQERLVDKYPTFHQRIRKSRNPLFMPHWQDDPDFDLARHLEVVQLPEPGDKAALEALVSEQRSQLLDQSRPLWKVYLIQGYLQDGVATSAMHVRIQHSIADGWALVRLVLSLADEGVERPKVVQKTPKRKRDTALKAAQPAMDAVDTVTGTVKRAAGAVVEGASRAAGTVTGLVRDPGAVPATLASGQDALEETLTVSLDPQRFLEFGAAVPDAVAEQFSDVAESAGTIAKGVQDAIDFTFAPRPGKTILHGDVTGRKKVVWIDPIPLAPVKQAGKALGATINDMLMGALTNALRRYLLEKDALTVDELFTAVPVSLRKPDAPLPRTLGNRFGLVPVMLPVRLADPVAQVQSIHDQVEEIKQGTMPIVSFGLISVTALSTPDVERMIHKINQDHSIGVTTNVPGPRHPLVLAGGKVLGAWGMGGLSGNMNLSFGIFSLNGEINFAVHSDEGITADPERILDHFLTSVDALLAAAGTGETEEAATTE